MKFETALKILKLRVTAFITIHFIQIKKLALLYVNLGIDNDALELGGSHIVEVLLQGKKSLDLYKIPTY